MEKEATSSCCHSGSHQNKVEAHETSNTNAIYTCPMHPEVRKVGPGSCSICGMALEPEDPFAIPVGPNPELIKMQRLFIWALVFTLPVFFLSMGEMLPWLHSLLPTPNVSQWLQLVFTTPVVFFAALPFHKLALDSLKTLTPNMFTLISLGTLSAYGFSVVATLFPSFFPTLLQNPETGLIGVYFEAAAVIITLVLLGQILELVARDRTGESVRALLGLKPKTAILFIDNDLETEIAVDKIEVGHILRIRPGTSIPVDGVITYGSSFVDESMLTGEPTPNPKGIGSKVIAGTINKNGSFLMRAEKVGRDTMLAQIVTMVSEAQRTKAPIQNLANKISEYFVPAVVIIAIAAFAIWMQFGPEPRLAYALVAAVSVLIIACPCALGLATPMAVTVGVGRGAQAGILIRNASSIEKLEKIDTLVIDKTGTLTEGKPRVVSLVPMESFSEDVLLLYAGALEKSSEHPLAQAILIEIKSRNLPINKEVSNFYSTTGGGVAGEIDGERCVLGNERFLVHNKIDLSRVKENAATLAKAGETIIYLSINGKLAGFFGVKDPIKSSSRAAIAALQSAGISIVLATGDSISTAKVVGAELGIEHIHAEVLPEQKLKLIKKLQSSGLKVAMAGDGVNDAPALAQADVGIAMGTGTDVAIESAGIVLVKGDLNSILHAMVLSRATMRNIRQNLGFAFAYNFLGVPLAAGALFPWYGLLLSPMVASLAMSLSSVSVIANSLRLRKIRL